ncbi:metallophosphoesterase family protein [Sphingomonas sp. UYP23]
MRETPNDRRKDIVATLRIIHSADWQLGKPFGRFPVDVRSALSEARLDVIDRLAEVAASSGARHVVVAGDVFDNVDPGDRVMMQALSRMQRAAATWWLMPGNHDHARADGLWSRVRARAPGNVRVVDVAEPVEMEEGAWLLPAPLEHRRTREDPTSALVDMATPPGALRIGLAHGSITEFGTSGESSNLIPPDRARTAGLDYLALGDWHGFMRFGDRSAYSGTPEVDRFGRDEPGSCALVTVRGGDVPEVDRVTTGRYRWIERRWEVDGMGALDAQIGELRREGALADMLLSLELTGVASLAERVGITEALRDRLAHEVRWLGVDDGSLVSLPTEEDVARIDVQGALAGAATTLRRKADGMGPNAAIASAALERLYVEAMRVDAEGAR